MNADRKIKIINIIAHGPAYHFSPNEKPEVCWEKQDGTWLGFWKREWPDLLGKAILKHNDHYDWEVWQPDYRADKIYSKKIETGVTHYLFPSEERVYRPGIRAQKGVFSKAIIERLEELKNNRIILHLHGFRVPFYSEILRIFGPEKKFPIFLIGHGMSKAPITEIFGIHRPLTYPCLIVEQLRLGKLLNYVDIISEQAESALREIRKVYHGRIEKLTMGCDFDFWVPVPSEQVKRELQYRLNISPDKTVFLATGNFIPRKQLDKLIEAFSHLMNRDDFYLIIAGHGDVTDTNLLESLLKLLAPRGKALLHPYVDGVKLRELHWASDVYISTATDEGGPVSVMKAMGCGLPVVTTPVGVTYELLKREGAGSILPVRNYFEWQNIINNILANGAPAPVDIEIAKRNFDWQVIAAQFITVYHELLL